MTSSAISVLAGRRRIATSPPPHAYFVGSAVFHYLGPAFAVLLFARVEPLGVAWFRIVSAAVVFALWRRPWRRVATADRTTRSTIALLGLVFATMNVCFYVAIDRLPLGTVAAIEFLPVIALAAVGARTLRNAVALGLAVTGVYLLTDVRLGNDTVGVRFRVRQRRLVRRLHRPCAPPGARTRDRTLWTVWRRQCCSPLPS